MRRAQDTLAALDRFLHEQSVESIAAMRQSDRQPASADAIDETL
jgi:hypothetical protein